MRLGQHMGIDLRAGQHVEFAVMHTDQNRYLYSQVVVLVTPVLDLIDIVKRIALQISLVEQLYRLVRTLAERSHTAPCAYSDVQQEARRLVGISGLQLV